MGTPSHITAPALEHRGSAKPKPVSTQPQTPRPSEQTLIRVLMDMRVSYGELPTTPSPLRGQRNVTLSHLQLALDCCGGSMLGSSDVAALLSLAIEDKRIPSP